MKRYPTSKVRNSGFTSRRRYRMSPRAKESTGKMVGGKNSHLESNPIPTRDSQGLILMGGVMLSKSLIQFSVDG